MSHRTLSSAVAGAMLAVGVSAAAFGSQPSTGMQPKTIEPMQVTFTLYLAETDFRFGKRWSIGDPYTEYGPVKRDGVRVGRHAGTCTVVQNTAQHRRFSCSTVVELPEGQLLLGGLIEIGNDYLFAVTGGTGQYEGATGQARITDDGDGGQLVEADFARALSADRPDH